jgi:hypothetical protein
MASNVTSRPIKPVKDFFGMSLAEMKAEWIQKDGDVPVGAAILTPQDKDDILTGLENGSLTY